MIDIRGEDKNSGGLNPEVRDLKKSKDLTAEDSVREISAKSGEEVESHATKKTAKKAAKPKTVKEILTEAFSVKIDKNGNAKLAKITKEDLKALLSVNDVISLDSTAVDSICKDAALTDPCLNCLTEIVLNVLGSSPSDNRKILFSLCIQIASGTWINRHRGSLDLFEDIFQSRIEREGSVENLEDSLVGIYQKRVTALERSESAKSIEGAVIPSSDSERDIKGNQYTKRVLEKQQKNLILIGVFWILDRGKADVQEVVDYLFDAVDVRSTSKATLRDVSLYLAGQYLTPESRFLKVLSLLRQKVHESEDNQVRIDKLLVERERQISQLQKDLSQKKQELEVTSREVDEYRSEVKRLEKKAEDQQLNERAARTHLRDSEGKVRAKAFNLLTEEVIEPLRLSLAALDRENPKAESAIHQIELALESIEREIKWFKE